MNWIAIARALLEFVVFVVRRSDEQRLRAALGKENAEIVDALLKRAAAVRAAVPGAADAGLRDDDGFRRD